MARQVFSNDVGNQEDGRLSADRDGRSPSGPGSQASPEAASASSPSVSIPNAGAALAWRVAMAIYREYENRPLYAQGQMNGALAAELAVAAIRAMREPTPAMLAAALPLISQPEQRHWKLATEALSLLPPVRVEQHFQGRQAAADLARDWEIMVDAATVTPASAMSAGTAETAQQAQGQRPASAVGEAETPTPPPVHP